MRIDIDTDNIAGDTNNILVMFIEFKDVKLESRCRLNMNVNEVMEERLRVALIVYISVYRGTAPSR